MAYWSCFGNLKSVFLRRISLGDSGVGVASEKKDVDVVGHAVEEVSIYERFGYD